MKNKYIIILFLLNIFLQIRSMELNINDDLQQESLILLMPNEIKLKIINKIIKCIIRESVPKYNPLISIRDILNNISGINQEFRHFILSFKEDIKKEIIKAKNKHAKALRLMSGLQNILESPYNIENIGLAANIIIEGVNINFKSHASLYTPLNIIAKNNPQFQNLIELLIEYGADINSKDYLDRTPLINAIQKSNTEIALQLLSKPNIDINDFDTEALTPLMHAIKKNNINLISEILKNPELNIDQRDNNHNNLLIYAIKNNVNFNIINILLNQPNIDINAKNINGNTALMESISKYRDIQIIKMLLANKKIDINIKDNLGKTAKDIAYEKRYSEAVDEINIKIFKSNKKLHTSLLFIASALIAYKVKTKLMKKRSNNKDHKQKEHTYNKSNVNIH
ncbi:MAG: ankyrin repeat domain-containing protein [Novosphingobium sp.]|nr:ankyrin repeat domain-containing protein [Novosphingobium sp.]